MGVAQHHGVAAPVPEHHQLLQRNAALHGPRRAGVPEIVPSERRGHPGTLGGFLKGLGVAVIDALAVVLEDMRAVRVQLAQLM